MKNFNQSIYLFGMMFLLFLSSCSSTKYGAHFQPTPETGNANKGEGLKNTDELRISKWDQIDEGDLAEKSQQQEVKGIASLKQTGIEVGLPKAEELTARQQKVLKEVRERLENMSRKEKRALRREIRKVRLADYTKDLPEYKEMGLNSPQQDDVNDVNLIALILAIFIPPLGVLIDQGVNNKFWISLVLTILGVTSFLFLPALGLLPAIIYSVLVVLDII